MIKKSIYVCVTTVLMCGSLSAASITIDSPPKSTQNRSPVTVRVMVDPEGVALSGISGDFSFPTELFSLGTISMENSAVPLWIVQPSLSEDKYFDGRTHVQFEGIFPGGFDGVRSPYYSGVKPGTVFSISLIPKQKGVGDLRVDNVTLNAFTSDARSLPTSNIVTTLENPALLPETSKKITEEYIESPTLNVFVTRDMLVNDNAWYLVVFEREQTSAVQSIYVAESDTHDVGLIDDYAWRKVRVPYVLLHQARTKFVHVKVVYSNHTYTTRTIAPVENYASIPFASRILIGIAFALFVLFLYGKYSNRTQD